MLCSPTDAVAIESELSCPLVGFPVKYLGIPLSIRKPSASALQPIADKLVKKLSTWRASLLTRGERLALVRHVLCAMPSHILMAMAICPPILRQINRIIREFLWHGRRDTHAGHGPVNWQRVCRPLELGGLGVRDLQRSGVALSARWLWLQRTDTTRPWAHLHLPSDPDAAAIFRASTSWTVGDGRTCLFWSDPWIDGQSILDIAPLLIPLVPRRRRKLCSVADGLTDRSWIRDIRGALGPAALLQYLDLWRRLRDLRLSPTPDIISWRWTSSGIYFASSCYRALFTGSIPAPHWRLTWKSWAPLRIKLFIWLADLDRCWTSARLARHGLPHNDRCALCDQETETMQHILIGCSFSRLVWHDLLAWCRATVAAPDGHEEFLPWCAKIISNSPAGLRKGIASLAILAAWSIWCHRNRCVFDGEQPSVPRLVAAIQEEATTWVRAGAQGLNAIIL